MTKVIQIAHYVLCFAGIGLALYSIHVESMLVELPGYTPACDISSWAMSCSKVFKSRYSRPLSHWGLVASGSQGDFSLPQIALLYFAIVMQYPMIVRSNKRTPALIVRGLTYAALGFNLYLAYILKFVLGEVCIVCVSNYFVNLGIWATIKQMSKHHARPTRSGKKSE